MEGRTWHQSRELAICFISCMQLLLRRAGDARRLQTATRPQPISEDIDEGHEMWFVKERLDRLAQFADSVV